MIFLCWFVLGLLVGQIQTQLVLQGFELLDLRLIGIALLIIPRFRSHEASRFVAFVLGSYSVTLQPLGVILTGAGVAAVLLYGLRNLVFLEHPMLQMVATATVWLAMLSCQVVAGRLHGEMEVEPPRWLSLGINAVATPIISGLLLLPRTLFRWKSRGKNRPSQRPSRVFGA